MLYFEKGNINTRGIPSFTEWYIYHHSQSGTYTIIHRVVRIPSFREWYVYHHSQSGTGCQVGLINVAMTIDQKVNLPIVSMYFPVGLEGPFTCGAPLMPTPCHSLHPTLQCTKETRLELWHTFGQLLYNMFTYIQLCMCGLHK